ncbi:SMI1/KNR4 family protein [Frankia sp. CNm7]|uniref:SMI1/KNR4 family protein n=1 Tax=Frankia nepalensis TaxID=1836974 RepID=A0A937ULQ0_9ACTN|nr:SMI1/KNR4 family protein [Frankia nepalensis]MBL7502374.1 SMI1/KNR4 family protein [Frankia nepalensis]MBL7508432.1 SMI1/KNR4 family protein [Frankia nepalensis]MBL7519438.1 SMI1/KNR4 family protein [Frankia nepalensis]MBL7626263.1 SMI1/KNR4 family protein [Frankia nepalensis]
MEFEEFEAQVEAFRVERVGRRYPPGFQLFDSWIATDADLAAVETVLRTRLPSKYKRFMQAFGGGVFSFVEILPARSPDARSEDLLSVNTGVFAVPNFVAVAPVGTGDWWGFVSEDGVCREQVSFLDHEDGAVQFDASDFYEFVSSRGLRVGV